MVVRRRFAVVAAAVAVLVVAATSVSASGSSAGQRPLATLLVRASQVGRRYQAHRQAWDKSTSVQSLSCNHVRERSARAVKAIGDEYTKAGARPRPFNVLFEYRTSTGAAVQLALLRRILTACPNLKIQAKSPQATFTLTLSLTRLPTPHGLLPGSVPLRQVTTETGAPRPARLIDIYQPDGKILSLAFAIGSTLPKLRALTTRVAQASAHNLAEAR